MKIVLQRVRQALVRIEGREIARISRGLLLFIGIEKGDSIAQAEALAGKIRFLRVFEDGRGKMNLSLEEVQGEVLVVPEFTLAADLTRGHRPGFDSAEEPGQARKILDHLTEFFRKSGVRVQSGEFGTHMEVELVNDGPVTFLL